MFTSDMSLQLSRRSAWTNRGGVATRKLSVLILSGLICCALCHCTADRDQKESKRYIVEGERQWAESVASGESGAVEPILADDFLGVSPDGRLYDKSKMISDTPDAPNISSPIAVTSQSQVLR